MLKIFTLYSEKKRFTVSKFTCAIKFNFSEIYLAEGGYFDTLFLMKILRVCDPDFPLNLSCGLLEF
jgi:hypothetical protein